MAVIGLGRALVTLAVLGGILGALAVGLVVASDHVTLAGPEIFFVAGNIMFVEVGLLTWWRRPDNRFGALMVVAGFVGLLGFVGASDTDWAYTVSLFLGPLVAPVAAHMILAFPTGRLGRLEGSAVALFWVAATVVSWPALLFEDEPGVFGHSDLDVVPENIALITASPTTVDVLVALRGALIAVAVPLSILALVRRWRSAGPLRRRALAPVLGAGGLVALLYGATVGVQTIDRTSGAVEVLDWSLLVYSFFPFAFVVGLVRGRMFGAGAVGALTVELADARTDTDLRERLATTLDDPSLELAYWIPAQGRHVDGRGVPVSLDDVGAGRTWTAVERGGRPVAAIVHRSDLTAADPDTVRAAGAAAALALENARLDAELRAKIAELAESRSRIIQAADDERRRLERDLHDGAQQRLVGLALTLRLARSRVDADPAAAAELLDRSARELDLALSELRELARGIHPAILTEQGLEPALRAIVSRAPLPVEVTSEVAERLPAAVEAAAYFATAEALTNVAKYSEATHASVSLRRRNGCAVVEIADDGVGGARIGAGTGLRGLADRVAALDGELVVDSPPGRGTRVVVEIPCGS